MKIKGYSSTNSKTRHFGVNFDLDFQRYLVPELEQNNWKTKMALKCKFGCSRAGFLYDLL